MNYRSAVERALAQQEDGWEYLYNKTYKDMYYCALMLLNRSTDAEDIVQTAYMQAYQKLDTLRDPNKFPAWMKRIVINLAIRYQEKNKPLVFKSFDSEDIGESELALEDNDTYDPIALAESKDVKRTLDELIGELPNDQRHTLLLYYYEGMTQSEIAEIFECSLSTVKSRLTYAKKKMKEKLEKKLSKGYLLGEAALMPHFMNLLIKRKSLSQTANTAGDAVNSKAVINETVKALHRIVRVSVADKYWKSVGIKLTELVLTASLVTGGAVGIFQLYNDYFSKPNPIPYIYNLNNTQNINNYNILGSDVNENDDLFFSKFESTVRTYEINTNDELDENTSDGFIEFYGFEKSSVDGCKIIFESQTGSDEPIGDDSKITIEFLGDNNGYKYTVDFKSSSEINIEFPDSMVTHYLRISVDKNIDSIMAVPYYKNK